jgi:hypothetical protein
MSLFDVVMLASHYSLPQSLALRSGCNRLDVGFSRLDAIEIAPFQPIILEQSTWLLFALLSGALLGLLFGVLYCIAGGGV